VRKQKIKYVTRELPESCHKSFYFLSSSPRLLLPDLLALEDWRVWRLLSPYQHIDAGRSLHLSSQQNDGNVPSCRIGLQKGRPWWHHYVRSIAGLALLKPSLPEPAVDLRPLCRQICPLNILLIINHKFAWLAVILDSVLGHSLFTSWQGEVEGTALNQSTLNPIRPPCCCTILWQS